VIVCKGRGERVKGKREEDWQQGKSDSKRGGGKVIVREEEKE